MFGDCPFHIHGLLAATETMRAQSEQVVSANTGVVQSLARLNEANQMVSGGDRGERQRHPAGDGKHPADGGAGEPHDWDQPGQCIDHRGHSRLERRGG